MQLVQNANTLFLLVPGQRFIDKSRVLFMERVKQADGTRPQLRVAEQTWAFHSLCPSL